MTVQQSVIRLQLAGNAYLKFQISDMGKCRVILSDGENKIMAYTNVSSILDLRDSIDNFQSACETFSDDEN